MEKVSQMFKTYFKRLVFRTAIFLTVLTIYIMDKSLLDFTSIWTNSHPMMMTPLIFIMHYYSWSLVGIALYITIRWEYTYRKYPERFLEETNSNLKCMNCTDKMCKIKSK